MQWDLSSIIPSHAQEVRIALGIVSFCPIGFCNKFGYDSVAWFDNIRFGVADASGAVGVPDNPKDQPPWLHLGPNPVPQGVPIHLAFNLKTPQQVGIQLFDLAGRRIADIHQGLLQSGPHALDWLPQSQTGRSLAQGIYFLRVEAETGARTKKLIIIRN